MQVYALNAAEKNVVLRHRGRHAEIFGWAKSLLSPLLPSFPFTFPFFHSSPSHPFPSVPLVVGPVNTVRSPSGGQSSPNGVCGAAPAESEFVHFSLKV